jgi:hypothetical protein
MTTFAELISILTRNHHALPYAQGSTAASTQYDNYFSLKGAWLLPFSLCLFPDCTAAAAGLNNLQLIEVKNHSTENSVRVKICATGYLQGPKSL